MMKWRYDENWADFRPGLPGEIEADPDALYIIQRGDVLMVREDGHERPMPERLDVAGQMFDQERFAGFGHPLPLRAELERDGQWARAQLQARETPHEDTVGPPIRAVIIDLEPTGTIDGFLGLFAGRATPALTIEDMNQIATAGWAGDMESVRLSGDPLGSLAGIDEIINRGDREAFDGLLHAIIEQPGGLVTDRVRKLYERVQHRAADPEFAAWPQYQAVYWLAVAMGQFRTASEDKA